MLQPSTTSTWPVDYTGILAWRQRQVIIMRQAPDLAAGALAYYKTKPVEFINHWCDTYDPRLAGDKDRGTRMPFVLFKRQAELVECLLACIQSEEPGLVEKSRDMGATWVCSAFSVWLWLFWDGAAIGWGSRKQELVDKLGDPDSIFEKIRMLIQGLPREFLPVGWNPKAHMSFMRIINPANGSTITGEAGDNIGRGGRKLVYFKDESAWYERPEIIEAALSDNTRIPIDLSSVHGLGNVFYRKRDNGALWTGTIVPDKTQVFIMDWRDHPAKTQAWYNKRKAKAEAEGLLHIFAQEVDRDYAASAEGLLIQREWVQAAIDAHTKLGLDDDGPYGAALDVADRGADTNALAVRQGIVLRELDEWGARDPAVTARRAIGHVTPLGRVALQYDCIGLGVSVKSEVNNLKDAKSLPPGVKMVPWDAGATVLNPDKRVIEGDKESPLNKDFYTNLKAQGWWELRNRFYRTWRAVTQGAEYDVATLISIDPGLERLLQLEKELCQVTTGPGAGLKLLIDKAPSGTKSPNLGDAVMMCYHPVRSGYDLARFLRG